MCGQETDPGFFHKICTGDMITQLADPFFKCIGVRLAIFFKAEIARCEIHPDILHALFFQVFPDGQGTIGTIHAFYFPFDRFHDANLQSVQGPGFRETVNLYHMVAKPGYFCRVEKVYTLDTINETATLLWKWAGNAKVLAIHGPMGIGKTTLIHALCHVIHVKDVVGSPTFSIINEYVYPEDGLDKILYHIDLYRLKDEQEALQAGIEECLYSGYKCLVEWPEKASALLPPGTLHIYMELVDEQTRQLQISKN